MLRVAVDGVDGAGKTHFADELAVVLRAAGAGIIRAGVDGFHRPRAERYRLGRQSPEGFYRDSYNYAALQTALLEPLGPNGNGWYRCGVFDVATDTPLELPAQHAQAGDILLFDGLFLHRPELREYWDFSLFLRVPFEVSVPRGAQRGEGYGSGDVNAPSNARYIGGQQLYFLEAQPERWASLVIDNAVLDSPDLISL
ncbi:uridine kinase [Deinococcus psychrotolerans]|uniref:Uridine kinase n=1 Tax=Deinococcus psychrotolerans TaxID=2489213 RepID=A0A3G8YG71_9DEIO|nr:uridine kinase [Deinococcus psychrotolerans]